LFESPFYWDQVPIVGNNFTQVVSVYIYSWAFVMLIPSWANEKKDHVSINKTIWSAAVASTVGYAVIGILCALSFQKLSSDDVLKTLSQPKTFILTRISAYLFSLFIISPGIPVYCISTRYNLYMGEVCGKKASFFWGVIAPWLVGFIFCQGSRFADFLNWTALIFSSVVNFILPLVLYLFALRHKEKVLKESLQKAYIPSSINEAEESMFGSEGKKYESVSLLGKIPVTDIIGLKTDKAFPKRMRSRTKLWVAFLLAIMTFLIVAQIFEDFYYLVILHQNLLD